MYSFKIFHFRIFTFPKNPSPFLSLYFENCSFSVFSHSGSSALFFLSSSEYISPEEIIKLRLRMIYNEECLALKLRKI